MDSGYYNQPEPDFDAMRRKFDKASRKYKVGTERWPGVFSCSKKDLSEKELKEWSTINDEDLQEVRDFEFRQKEGSTTCVIIV